MKKLFILLFVVCLSLIPACGNDNKDLETKRKISSEEDVQENKLAGDETEEKESGEEEFEAAEYGNELTVIKGIYEVGDYIQNTNYRIICEESEYSMKIVVFSSMDNFNAYQNAEHSTNGKEVAAIEQNAVYNYYLKQGEEGFLSLDSGWVVMISNGKGKLKEIDNQNTNKRELHTGIYFVGDNLDIEDAQYIFSCKEAEHSMKAVLFETVEDYMKYYRTSRFTVGEEADAMEENALDSGYAKAGDSVSLSLKQGYILLISDGIGELEKLS